MALWQSLLRYRRPGSRSSTGGHIKIKHSTGSITGVVMEGYVRARVPAAAQDTLSRATGLGWGKSWKETSL